MGNCGGKEELGGFGEDREKWLGEGEKVDSLQKSDQVSSFFFALFLFFVPEDCAVTVTNSRLPLEN